MSCTNYKLVLLLLAIISVAYARKFDLVMSTNTPVMGQLASFTLTNLDDGDFYRGHVLTFRVQSPNLKGNPKYCHLFRWIQPHDLGAERGLTSGTSCIGTDNKHYLKELDVNANCNSNGNGLGTFMRMQLDTLPPNIPVTCTFSVSTDNLIPQDSTITLDGHTLANPVVVNPIETVAKASPGEPVSKSKPWQFYTTLTASEPGMYEMFVRTAGFVWDSSIYDKSNFYCSNKNARIVWTYNQPTAKPGGKLQVHFLKADTEVRCLFGIKLGDGAVANTDVMHFSIHRDNIQKAFNFELDNSVPLFYKGSASTILNDKVHVPMVSVDFSIPPSTPKGEVFFVSFRNEQGTDLTALVNAFAATSATPAYTVAQDATQRNRFTVTAGRLNENIQTISLLFTQTTPLDFSDSTLFVDVLNKDGKVLNTKKRDRIQLDYRSPWKIDEIWAGYKLVDDVPSVFQLGATITPTHLNTKQGAYLVFAPADFSLDVAKAVCTANNDVTLTTKERLGHLYVITTSDVLIDTEVAISCDVPSLVPGHNFPFYYLSTYFGVFPANHKADKFTLETMERFEPKNLRPIEKTTEIKYPIVTPGHIFEITIDLSKSSYEKFSIAGKQVKNALQEFHKYLTRFTMAVEGNTVTPYEKLPLEELFLTRGWNPDDWHPSPESIYKSESVSVGSNFRVKLYVGVKTEYPIESDNKHKDLVVNYFNDLMAKGSIKNFVHKEIKIGWFNMYAHCMGTANAGSANCAPKHLGDDCVAHSQCYSGYCSSTTGRCGITRNSDEARLLYYSPSKSSAMFAQITTSFIAVLIAAAVLLTVA